MVQKQDDRCYYCHRKATLVCPKCGDRLCDHCASETEYHCNNHLLPKFKRIDRKPLKSDRELGICNSDRLDGM